MEGTSDFLLSLVLPSGGGRAPGAGPEGRCPRRCPLTLRAEAIRAVTMMPTAIGPDGRARPVPTLLAHVLDPSGQHESP